MMRVTNLNINTITISSKAMMDIPQPM